MQMSYWYLESESLGKVAVGKNVLASKSAAMFTDLSGTQIIANYVLFDGGGFFLRQNGTLRTNLKWGDFGYCYSQQRPWGGDCDGIVMEGVRYDSPDLRRLLGVGELGRGRRLGGGGPLQAASSAASRSHSAPATRSTPTRARNRRRSRSTRTRTFFQAGGYVQHLATGLFVHAIYGREDNNNATTLLGFTEPDTHQWYVKGGIRQQWLAARAHGPLRRVRASISTSSRPAALEAGATASELSRWGFGAVQEIDAASMSLWIKYRQQEVSITGGGLGGIDDFRYVSVGSLINF